MKKGKVAFFVTGNMHKFHEARDVLREFGISTAMLDLETPEIQADDIDLISKTSASEAAQKAKMPIFVEDAGLFIQALKGFPGPYSSYVHQKIGNKGILKLMQNISQRDAHFCSVVAFNDSGKANTAKFFIGNVNGKITCEEQGKLGFGFDPIFAPLAQPSRTFAEMKQHEKNKHSHRAQALRKFGTWYTKQYAQTEL